MFKFSQRSLQNLIGVNPDLRRVIQKSIEITEIDFVVIEGLRSEEKQHKLVEDGASQTYNSRHITGHAVDLAALPNGVLSWEFKYYKILSEFVKKAAELEDVKIEWGGDWKSFKDGCHFQLPWRFYP